MEHIEDEILLAYIDGSLSSEEATKVKAAIAKDKALRARLKELQQFESLMQSMEVPKTASNFTYQVMTQLQELPPKPASTFSLNGLLIILLGLATAFFIIFNISSLSTLPHLQSFLPGGWSDTVSSYLDVNSGTGLPSYELLLKGFVPAYGLLLLIVFDRTVLQPYFQARKRRWQEGV